MADKVFNTRLINKHDTEANWLKATGFIPKQGEIIVYDVDDNYTYERFKIGDGVSNVNDLPFTMQISIDTTLTQEGAAADAKVVGDIFNSQYSVKRETGNVISIDTIEGLAIHPTTYIEPVQEGSGDPSPDNVRTISGWNSVSAWAAGANLYNPDTATKGYALSSNGGTYVSASSLTTDYIPVKSGQRIVIGWSELRWGCFYTDEDANSYIASFGNSEVSVPNNCRYIRVTAPIGDEKTLSVCYANVPANGAAYQPIKALTADLPETVYGGKLDWTTGVMTVGMYKKSASDFRTIVCGVNADGVRYADLLHNGVHRSKQYGDCVSNVYKSLPSGTTYSGAIRLFTDEITVYDERFTDEDVARALLEEMGFEVVYELEEPYTIQLTPQQLSTVEGQNNIWSDAGITEALINLTPINIATDTTLTAANTPADAKAVGDALAGKQPVGNYALKNEIPSVPVQSVNNKTGAVTLTASDVGADASGSANTALTNAKAYTDQQIDSFVGDTPVSTQITNAVSSKLDKTTYEYNKELALGSSGKVCIGKFPMYDSNISVEIKSTTNVTYNGTLIIATQNINTTGGGSYIAMVYGDADNSLTNSIKIHYGSGSNVFSIYIDLPSWSKNLLHIQCVSLAGTPTDIATEVSSIPSNATIVPVNALKVQLDSKATKEELKASTADWNQNDPNANNYVKNRTHWVEETGEALVPLLQDYSLANGQLTSGPVGPIWWCQVTTPLEDYYYTDDAGTWPVKINDVCTVTYNNTTYVCTVYQSMNAIVIGDSTLFGVSGGNGEPFLIGFSNSDGNSGVYSFIYCRQDQISTTPISISRGASEIVHKLNTKFIDTNQIATTGYAYQQGYMAYQNALQQVAYDYQTDITGAATTITDSNLTTNRALISNSSGKVAVSAVTSTELGYLDGVTSNIQTQLNNKISQTDMESYINETFLGGAW